MTRDPRNTSDEDINKRLAEYMEYDSDHYVMLEGGFLESLDNLIPAVKKWCSKNPDKHLSFGFTKEYFDENKSPARDLALGMYKMLGNEL